MSLQAQLQDALSNPAFPGGVGKEGGSPSPHITVKFLLKQCRQSSPTMQTLWHRA